MYQYTYDANGNIATSVERSYDKGTGGVPTNSSYSKSSYTYDSLNQLTQITDDSQKEKTKISYDNAGNITKVQVYNSSTNALKKTNTYGYDTTWKDKLTSYNGETITYDAIENPLKYRNGMTMQWKNGRQLSQVKTAKDTVTYKYNINGLRTQKDNSDYTNYYYYDENNNLIAMIQGGTVAYFYYDSNNSITAMSLNNTMYYYIKNLQGDVTKIVNEEGQIVVEYTYDAWGNILNETANIDYSYATVQSFNPFRYRGYVYDTDTGLYYLQSRYYDPKTGRFINADDTAYIGDTGTVLSANIFAYCENNPICRADKNGNVDANVVGAVIGGIIGAVGGHFLTNWLADKLRLRGWKRTVFVWGLTAVIGAASAVIGYFIGPYVAKAWSAFSDKLSGLIKGTFKSIGKVTAKKMSHINVSKHLLGKIMKRVTSTQIKTVINLGIRKGSWKLLSNGTVKILYKYKGQIIVIIGDAWVWNGKGKP